MLEPLIWMFKNLEFKKHFLYLFLVGILFLVLEIIVSITTFSILDNGNFYQELIIRVIQIILFLLPILCLTGYFWCLADSIVNREDDIIANNIYNGKIKTVKKITLPKFNFFKFVWRGIASIFATLLMYIPLILILLFTFFKISSVAEFWRWSSTFATLFFTGLIVFISTFIPALLWNYARRDSIVAVWNIPKAVYIMGTYTGQYILNTFLFFVLSAIHAYIIKYIMFLSGLDILYSISASGQILYSVTANGDIIIPCIIVAGVSYLISLYWLYVNAYLLGTIAPSSEA